MRARCTFSAARSLRWPLRIAQWRPTQWRSAMYGELPARAHRRSGLRVLVTLQEGSQLELCDHDYNCHRACYDLPDRPEVPPRVHRADDLDAGEVLEGEPRMAPRVSSCSSTHA